MLQPTGLDMKMLLAIFSIEIQMLPSYFEKYSFLGANQTCFCVT